MFYHFLYPLKDIWFGFNVFKYITFRAAFCGVTAFLFSLLIGPYIIRRLTILNIKEKILRPDAPTLYAYHQHKEGTPTMGGIIIIAALVFSTILWADLTNRFILISLAGTLLLGGVGFADDYIKLTGKLKGTIISKAKGMRSRVKLLAQILIGASIGAVLFLDPTFPSTLNFPFLKNLVIDLGAVYILFAALVLVASSNAVNITDGLDGLAIGCIIIIAITYGVMSYVTGHIKFSEYLNIFYHPQAGELAIFCAGVLGSGLGFLWFNSYPASIFMGDTGSLALGGAMGIVAVIVKKELLLFLVGGIFVIETLSVILQVIFFKLRKRRIFLMAPLHHHFQLMGWAENKIIIRFWIVAIMLSLLTLATLKLR